MSGPTPGPWEANDHGTVWAVSPWNARVCLAEVTEFSPMNGIDSAANARLIAAAPTGLATAEEVYAALLRHPHDDWRISNQRAYCLLRDFIAAATGRTEQDVQEAFEEAAITGADA